MKRLGDKGFTLIELLMVAAIMGLVMMSVYSLYLNTQDTALTSEEVVDAQQNLRVALDNLVIDIRMAGFLVPTVSGAIVSAPAILSTGGPFTFNAPVSTGSYARSMSTLTINGGGQGDITVDAQMGAGFIDGDEIMVVNPITLAVAGTVTVVVAGVAGDTLTVSVAGAAVAISSRDMLLRVVTEDTTFPVLIAYQLVDDPESDDAAMLLLQRSINGAAAATVASNITEVELTYLDSFGADSSADLDQIQSVQIVVSAKTEDNRIGKNKVRQLQTVAKVRNM